ncbi:hypothetical protein RGQ01_04915 [Akkermansia sp. EB-AMDK43]|jgi:hypothetical protein|uniref:Chromosome partition protein Smc n=7 Tax=Akkermansia TaxID=239934 RepID=A0ABT0R9Y0_9BACT|nr:MULTISPECIES: hypothetical protein [Akkermansia]MBT8779752.1 hypothetical protein [Akkermansia muciniphila]MBP8662266.1 hypothetical protein [Akkermansia sp.]MBT9602983.1 hypothetical protein [Akkermansia muciniphila]MCL6657752.1 hypothetical protein [Akkermansia massiliensis]WMX39089.1 hypothetical protein RGQ01_04915 [Akkermansia sp. EB-AMDK43]
MTDAGSRMRAAFQDNPGLEAFIDDATGAVLTAEELKKKFEQIDDVAEVLNNKMSDLDLGAKWGENLDENLQKILDGYNKEMDAADKAAEKAAAAEARKQQQAAATVERLEAGNRRAAASYEELRAELEIYIAKLEEARKAGDNVAQADALKNIQDLEKRITAAGKAGELTRRQVRGLSAQVTEAAARILGMSSSLRGAIPFIRLFGTSIKAAMGPLGWALLLFQGLTAGITALVNHFKSKSDELERQAEEKKKNMDKLIKEANELKAKLNNESILQKENDLTARIADNRKIEVEALREAVREQRRLIDLQSKILDEQDRARLLDVETDFYNGKYGDPNSPEARRKLDRVQEGIRMDANARHRTEAEEAAQGSVTNAGKELSKAVESLNQIKDRLAVLENTPILSLDELKQIEGEISKIESGKITFPDWEKLYAARKQRDNSDQALKEAGYDITTETARENAYKANDEALRKAREEQTKALEAQYKAEDTLEQATKELAERRALNAAQSARDTAQQRNTEAKQKNAQRQEEEKAIQDARKKEEARQKVRDAAMKEATRDAVKQQEKLIKNAPFEGIPQHPTPQQQKRVEAVQEAWEAGKKRLLEGIGGDDNTLDASEINAAINEALQTLRRQGESTDRFMAAVVNNFSNLATTINANIQRAQDMTNKRIDELERTQKRINRQVEYNIQGIRRVAMH